MAAYHVLEVLGEGAHGVVVKAREHGTEKVVALKKISIRNTLPIAVFREINCLRHLHHQNVVPLYHVFQTPSAIVLVFEYIKDDLYGVLKHSKFRLPISKVRSLMFMVLSGVAYIHSKQIIHRDLKPANLLIQEGFLKICDFGQSRLLDDEMSHQVATRWYRAPELLYGSRKYTYAVDCWAIGCILAELLNHMPLFCGQNDIDQLFIVLQNLGSPELVWPTVQDLPDYGKIRFPDFCPLKFEDIVPDSPKSAVDLVSKFLCYDPKKRICCLDALKHEFFKFADTNSALDSE